MSQIAETGRIPMWTLADRIRKARESAGLSQTDLAGLTGISRRSLSNYGCLRVLLNCATLRCMEKMLTTAEVAKRLGVSVATVNRRANAGKLRPSVSFPGHRGARLYDAAHIDALAEEKAR